MKNVVLLVEDNQDDVLLIQRAFAKLQTPIDLRVVNHGDAAVDYLAAVTPYADRAQHPIPQLVLLDLKLPRRSGLEVLAWLRQQAGLRRLPVVVLTSSREAADLTRAYDLGANSYLMKPVTFDDLLDLMRSVDHYWLTLNQPPLVDHTPG